VKRSGAKENDGALIYAFIRHEGRNKIGKDARSHAVKLTLRLAWICQRFANSLLIN